MGVLSRLCYQVKLFLITINGNPCNSFKRSNIPIEYHYGSRNQHFGISDTLVHIQMPIYPQIIRDENGLPDPLICIFCFSLFV